MGTPVTVESINILPIPNTEVSGIFRCSKNLYNTDKSRTNIDAFDIRYPVNSGDLKFYFDPSDSTRVYSTPFQFQVKFSTVDAGSTFRYADVLLEVAISATAASKDENDVPILTDLRLVNIGWSRPKNECFGVGCDCSFSDVIVGLKSDAPSPTGKYFFSLKLQYKIPDGTVPGEGTLTLGYTTYSRETLDLLELPSIPRTGPSLPKVNISFQSV